MERRIASIDEVAASGGTVISADDEAIVEIIKKAVDGGVSASFYVPRGVADTVMAWYWTPERIEALKVEVVSSDELKRIETDLGLKDVIHFANRTPCENCGHVYGAYEFVAQGIRAHGREAVEAVLELKEAVLIRVNPSEVSVCPNCNG
ncbi:hypothetical protein [Streptomyces cinerochromogenes]|uniref:hypothetical protein n=1 Tax=Streptomyces cinerochromogenes TaxID=66422 RepID=UPI0016712513|nr:hypothetical protein [Streptomyces cinerochromogenes]GGS69911.1 hypothetical protein GCM10010206_35260 [Streptomyces cinerochromogenes]